jgi:hypothetical protein
MQIRRTAAALTSAAALSVTGVAMATPASAAPSTNQQGLVNISLTNTTVQIPLAVAANVCGVAVNVLAQGIAQGPVECDATGVSTAAQGGDDGDPTTNQDGLVNVAVTNTTVQVPVAVAANICGVAVNALASQTFTSPVSCEALGGSDGSAEV